MHNVVRRMPGVPGPAEPRSVRSLLEAPLWHPWLVVVPFVLVTVAAVAATFLVPKLYRSTTLILVDADKVPESFVQQQATDTTRKRLYTLSQEILSRTRLETVLKELHPYPGSQQSLSEDIEEMRRAISIRTKGDDAFSVEFVHRDPDMAMKVANRLTTLFIEEGAERREQQVAGTSRFIETQLEEARTELEAREAALGQFKQKRMGTLPQQLDSNLSTLQRLQLEQQTIAESLRAAEDRLSAMQGQGTPSSGPPTELQQLRRELAQLRGRYTDQHPDVLALAARVERLERAAAAGEQVADGGSTLLTETRAEVQSLQARRRDTERRMAAIQNRVESAPRTEQELATLTRDYEKLNENYQALLNKKLEAQLAEKLEKRWKGERFKIIDPANRPERPFSPNRRMYVGLGALAGLALGLALAVGSELLSRSVRTVGELQALFGQPVLATVSHIPDAAELRVGGRR